MKRKGFTLIEILFFLLLGAVAGIIISFYIKQGRQTEILQSNLWDLRSAISQFHKDTGCWPKKPVHLLRSIDDPPEQGLDDKGKLVPIDPATYSGPYLLPFHILPTNPITKGHKVGIDWFYQTSPPNVGQIHPSPGLARNGTDYADW